MAPKKQQRSRKKNGRRIVPAPQIARARMARPVSNEERLMRLILDPCGAEMAHGYALSSEGIVQRFTQYYTPAATTETAFAFAVDPLNYGATGGVKQVLGTSTIGSWTGATLPGQTFIDTNADAVCTLAACVEVLYTGPLMERKGYIAVAQGSSLVISDTIGLATNTFSTLVAISNAVAPVPSSTVSLKWTPSVQNFTGGAGLSEVNQATNQNALMVTAVGVNPNHFVVRVTIVYEYQPKAGLGMPLARATRVTPVGVGSRITSALDRMGHWWHNVGEMAAAAARMGNQAVYGAGQVARLTRGVIRTGEAATALLALTG